MKKIKREVVTALITIVSLSAVMTTGVYANIKFTDINNNFAKSHIEKLVEEGVLQGFSDGTFKPNQNITRAQFVRMVNKAFNLTEKGSENFKDVKEDAWYYNDLLIAKKAGYINGYKDNTFRPNENITRQEIAKILGTMLKVSSDGKTNFKDDSDISFWAKKYVDGLTDIGIFSGYKDNTFKPKGNATRAESAKIIHITSEKYKNNSNDNNLGGNIGGGVIIPDDDITTTTLSTVLPSNPTKDDIDSAFNSYKEVVINGDLSTNIVVPIGKTLNLKGNINNGGSILATKGSNLVIKGVNHIGENDAIFTLENDNSGLEYRYTKNKNIESFDIIVRGNVTINKDYSSSTIISTEGARLSLNKTNVILCGVDKIEKGIYIGQPNGFWKKEDVNKPPTNSIVVNSVEELQKALKDVNISEIIVERDLDVDEINVPKGKKIDHK